MSIRTILTDLIAEQSTPVFTFTFVDGEGALLTALDTAVVTLYDRASGEILNNRDHISLLDDSPGLNVVAEGVAIWRLDPEDTPVLDDTLPEEVHLALIEWSWDEGTKAGKHELVHTVRNLAQVGG